MKPLIYLASPYAKGNQALNAEFQFKLFNELMDWGTMLIYPPLWTHFYHSCHSREETDWLEMDFRILKNCDAVLRLPAKNIHREYFQHESAGADKEVALAKESGIPVFHNIPDLVRWVDDFALSKK